MNDIMARVHDHYLESLETFSENQIVGIFLQGSQNYGLEAPGSDVDTKLVVTPTFEEIAMNRTPITTTHIRANEEHIDFKDIRKYMETFRKQNLNFLEILFTPYFEVNPLYAKEWNRLVSERERIAHMNPFRAVKSMKGIALEKFHALQHEYPSKIEILRRFGYDPKQLHHLLRVEEYLQRYIAGESYAECLSSRHKDFLKEVKMGALPLDAALKMANESLERLTKTADTYCATLPGDVEDSEVRALLDDVQKNIMRISIAKELEISWLNTH